MESMLMRTGSMQIYERSMVGWGLKLEVLKLGYMVKC
jgi:hypothetical protein